MKPNVEIGNGCNRSFHLVQQAAVAYYVHLFAVRSRAKCPSKWPELWRPPTLQPFWDIALWSLIYVLLEVAGSTRFACSSRCLGARILRCVGGTKRGAEGEAPLGRTQKWPQECAKQIQLIQSVIGTLRMGMLVQACLFREIVSRRMSTYSQCFRTPPTILQLHPMVLSQPSRVVCNERPADAVRSNM